MHNNNIERLKTQLAAERRELDTLLDELRKLRAYLTGDKFRDNPTVSVSDVVARLNAAEDTAFAERKALA